MRIISKFKDYYDSVQSYGQDKSLVYIRNTEEIRMFNSQNINDPNKKFDAIKEKCLDTESHELKGFSWGGQYKFGFVGFCGNYFPFVVHERYENSDPLAQGKYYYDYFYDSESLRDELNKTNYFKTEGVPKKWEKKKKPVKEYIDMFNRKPANKFFDIFVEYKIPVFAYYDDYLIGRDSGYKFFFNPQLSKLQFYKVKQPYQAFQEIEQFMSGVLGVNAPVMVELSDKERTVKAGFDKWSFRKMPERLVKR